MADETSIYLLETPELRQFLGDNSTSISELLQQGGIAVEERRAANPERREGEGSRDLVSILLGSAKVMAALGPAISSILGKLVRKEIVVEEWVLIPVLDGNGAAVRDKDGQPILSWVRRHKILNNLKEERELDVQGPMGVRVTFRENK